MRLINVKHLKLRLISHRWLIRCSFTQFYADHEFRQCDPDTRRSPVGPDLTIRIVEVGVDRIRMFLKTILVARIVR